MSSGRSRLIKPTLIINWLISITRSKILLHVIPNKVVTLVLGSLPLKIRVPPQLLSSHACVCILGTCPVRFCPARGRRSLLRILGRRILVILFVEVVSTVALCALCDRGSLLCSFEPCTLMTHVELPV